MRIYIASPFFNEQQKAIEAGIRGAITRNHHSYYAPMIDSGSQYFTEAQKRDQKSWVPVFDSNVRAIVNTELMIAAIEYALPPGQKLQLIKEEPSLDLDPEPVRTVVSDRISFPDTGVVWEMGAAFFSQICGRFPDDPPIRTQLPCVAFVSQPNKSAKNLMLMFGCSGVIEGYDKLDEFLQPPNSRSVWEWQFRMKDKVEHGLGHVWPERVWKELNWSAVESFAGEVI